MMIDGSRFLGHKYDLRCLVRTSDEESRYWKLIYLEVDEDCTRHTYKEFTGNASKYCLDRLIKISMSDLIEIDEHGYPNE